MRIASETREEGELRLEKMRKRRCVNIESESERENAGERRVKEAQASSHEEYLRQGGWQDVDNPLYEQEWVTNDMNRFHSSQEMLQHCQCTVCKEMWPTKQNLAAESIQWYVSKRCKRDKKSLKVYSADNDMDPGLVPQQLQGLPQVEEMLIARLCPIMSMYPKHGGQRRYREHMLNLPQDIQSFLNRLPSCVFHLPILVVTRHGVHNSHSDFTVSRHQVLEAVVVENKNLHFKDVEIDREAIENLPENGIPSELTYVESIMY